MENGCQFSVNSKLRGEALFVNVFVPNRESCLRQNGKVVFICVKKTEYLLSVFFKRKKNIKRSLCLTCFFHKIQGNGGARGASHIVILFNPLRPKSDLNEIYHCNIKGLSVREIMRIENMISQVTSTDLSDERFISKLRVTENRCVVFEFSTYACFALLPQH